MKTKRFIGRDEILKEAFKLVEEKGIKFTLNDIAKNLSISKKTIYKFFRNKENLIENLVEEIFRSIKIEEDKIYSNQELSLLEKIEKIVVVMPEKYKELNYKEFEKLKIVYPNIHSLIVKKISLDWDKTIELLETGINEKVIRDIPIDIFKLMVEGSIEKIMGKGLDGYSYLESLEYMMNILMKGIKN